MIYKIGDNIISSLGFTTEENFNAVKQGISGVKHYDAGTFDLPEAFMASLIDKTRLNDEFFCHCGLDPQSPIARESDFCRNVGYSDLEKSAILSVHHANEEALIDLSNEKVLFIISTTKGNVDMLVPPNLPKGEEFSPPSGELEGAYLWYSAKIISGFFKNPNTPLVVSNACISGAAAQIAAKRELQAGNYDYAVVTGIDFLSKFIISGFQSFKALSPEICRPFDKDRCGLNLGEAAATIIFSKEPKKIDKRTKRTCALADGLIRNDANHISAPSRTGEGSYRALNYLLNSIESNNPVSQISFINAHGTATPYNDAMEVNAIVRAGLDNVPVNSLKTFFGHTLGAAGVLESVISMKALEENLVLKSFNFHEQSFENQINISQENHFSDKRYFIKMLSGFGGVNAALLFDCPQITQITTDKIICGNLWIKKQVHLSFKTPEEITGFYRSLQVDYPKFFKMDGLSKLGFLASEMIFKDYENRFIPREDAAVVCFNSSSSLDIDVQYQDTINNIENYFPSPSLFVYTLPNIVTGEIAIRNKFFGETSFYIFENFEKKHIFRTVLNVFSDKITNFVLLAWIEYFENTFEASMFLVTKEQTGLEFTVKNLEKNYKNPKI